MEKVMYIGYNKRSCVTGKALFDYIKSQGLTNIKLRRCMSNAPKINTDIFIRWGSSLFDVPDNCIELNTQESVTRSSEKLQMIRTLSEDENVRTPIVSYTQNEATRFNWDNCYIRDTNDKVRYDHKDNFSTRDKYALNPVDKIREYRVHVFDGKVIGVYQKIPNNSTELIYKNDNCTFRRIDVSDTTQRELILGIRPMAKSAVQSLGLLFGGVDVLVGRDGTIYVNEVNTAPSLNGPNIKRWGDCIIEYVKTQLNNEGEGLSSQQDTTVVNSTDNGELESVEQQSTGDGELVSQQRYEARDSLINRLQNAAQVEGFTITTLNLSDDLGIIN